MYLIRAKTNKTDNKPIKKMSFSWGPFLMQSFTIGFLFELANRKNGDLRNTFISVLNLLHPSFIYTVYDHTWNKHTVCMYWKVCFSFSLLVFSQFLFFYIPYIYIVYKSIDSFTLINKEWMYQAFSGKHVKLPKRFAKIAGRYANFIFIDVTMVIENRV